MSYTEKEFKYAVKNKIPVLAFLQKDFKSHLVNADVDKELMKKLEEFRGKVEKSGRIVKYWDSAQELGSMVLMSLQNAFDLNKRPGWVRADPNDISPEEAMKIAKDLKNEVKKMKATNASLQDDRSYKIKNVEFKMIFVQGGPFVMGVTEEQVKDAEKQEYPAHIEQVKDYWIGETQVTQGLWETVMGDNPSRFSKSHGYEDGPIRPVEQVTWYDCLEFIKRLNEQLEDQLMDTPDYEFQLPTEAQWEYAARGGNRSRGYKYAGDEDIEVVAVFSPNSENKTQPVKSKGHPNELGIYDMSGNVWEWCHDEFSFYGKDNQTDSNVSKRVGRGGCWHSEKNECRVSHRAKANKTHAGNGLGLRLVLALKKVIIK